MSTDNIKSNPTYSKNQAIDKYVKFTIRDKNLFNWLTCDFSTSWLIDLIGKTNIETLISEKIRHDEDKKWKWLIDGKLINDDYGDGPIKLCRDRGFWEMF